jgi:Pyridine nucleotide-disulphide oxidoreductase
MPQEEPEASQVIAAALAAEGVEIGAGRDRGARRGTAWRWCRPAAPRLGNHPGRGPRPRRRGPPLTTDALGLQAIGVVVDEGGCVRTDTTLATTVPGIWAAGDVTGRTPFTHAAARMGMIAARNALATRGRRRRRFDPWPIRWVTFTAPSPTSCLLCVVRRGARRHPPPTGLNRRSRRPGAEDGAT